MALTVLFPEPIPPVRPITRGARTPPSLAHGRSQVQPRQEGGPPAGASAISRASVKLATRRRRITVSGGGAVSAVVALPSGFRRAGKTPAVLLAHGAGADMRSPFMST